ncbi:MAG: helix-turn-helix transcriptional regulator [Myxococcales bacterium]|nr:helix-turn-helix transcriptional regulator [Myxococcales bacterium]
MSTLVSARLGKLCEDAGVSHESVSLSAGLAGGHVGLIVSGRVKRPSADVLAKIADVLGVSLDWIVLGRGDSPDPSVVRIKVRERAASRTRATTEAA